MGVAGGRAGRPGLGGRMQGAGRPGGRNAEVGAPGPGHRDGPGVGMGASGWGPRGRYIGAQGGEARPTGDGCQNSSPGRRTSQARSAGLRRRRNARARTSSPRRPAPGTRLRTSERRGRHLGPGSSQLGPREPGTPGPDAEFRAAGPGHQAQQVGLHKPGLRSPRVHTLEASRWGPPGREEQARTPSSGRRASDRATPPPASAHPAFELHTPGRRPLGRPGTQPPATRPAAERGHPRSAAVSRRPTPPCRADRSPTGARTPRRGSPAPGRAGRGSGTSWAPRHGR